MTLTKVAQAASVVRAQIADGTLKPGSLAPSGPALARVTGFSDITCRKAIATLVRNGTLVPGSSPNSRARVAAPAPGQPADSAIRDLSAALPPAREAGATGPEPDPVCVLVVWGDGSVTTVPPRLADLIVSELKTGPPANPRRTENGNAGL